MKKIEDEENPGLRSDGVAWNPWAPYAPSFS